jgi:hypothetical protein
MHLPNQVVAQRTAISPTAFEYTFRHDELGELGRVLLSAGQEGNWHLVHQMRRTPGDAAADRRRALFEPIVAAVQAQICAMQKA